MQYLLFFIFIFIIWTLFWSFSSVIIWRLRNNEKWILTWRSMCPTCKHMLHAKDLVPIFSYISTKWKCRYCNEKVSIRYPIYEFVFWIFFAISWLMFVDINLLFMLNSVEIIKLITILFITFITLIFVIYDILYTEVPEEVMAVWIVWVLAILVIQTFAPNISVFTETIASLDIFKKILLVISSVWIVWWFYAIMLKWFDEKIDILITIWLFLLLFYVKNLLWINFENSALLSWVMSALVIFTFFLIQILVSNWVAMWQWDLRIAIFMWLILGFKLWLAWLFIAYLVWSVIGILILVIQKIWKKKKDSTVPFGPFLACWLLGAIYFQTMITEYMDKLFYL